MTQSKMIEYTIHLSKQLSSGTSFSSASIPNCRPLVGFQSLLLLLPVLGDTLLSERSCNGQATSTTQLPLLDTANITVKNACVFHDRSRLIE